jgi:fluoroquinolone transport system permease protein
VSRFLATLRTDVRLQLRYGFYLAGAFVAAIWIAILSQLPPAGVRVALPAFLFLNGLTTTYFFVAGLVLFEKREGVLQALVVTPLREGEYLASKVATLTALAALEGIVIVLLGWGTDLNLTPIVLGSLLIGAIYTLFGFLVVFRYDSINEFLLPASAFAGLLQLPVIGSFGVWDAPYFWLWPTKGALLLFQAGFAPLGAGQWAYALLASGLWIALLSALVLRAFRRFIVRSEGVR